LQGLTVNKCVYDKAGARQKQNDYKKNENDVCLGYITLAHRVTIRHVIDYGKARMKKVVVALMAVVFVSGAEAKPTFTSQNYSGVYACKGNNELVGDYEMTATLKLKRLSSYGRFGTYEYSTETENSVTYLGQAVADGSRMALTFKLSDGRNAEFSTGVAEIVKNPQGHWSFRNMYYEADDTGGNYGSEYCVMKTLPVKALKKKPAQ
jgi:hypothetical protein